MLFCIVPSSPVLAVKKGNTKLFFILLMRSFNHSKGRSPPDSGMWSTKRLRSCWPGEPKKTTDSKKEILTLPRGTNILSTKQGRSWFQSSSKLIRLYGEIFFCSLGSLEDKKHKYCWSRVAMIFPEYSINDHPNLHHNCNCKETTLPKHSRHNPVWGIP